MKRFQRGDRVRIVRIDRTEDDRAVIAAQKTMSGRTGTVQRVLMRDISAWVRMDDALPAGLATFPDADPRSRDLLLWPNECEPEQAPLPSE